MWFVVCGQVNLSAEKCPYSQWPNYDIEWAGARSAGDNYHWNKYWYYQHVFSSQCYVGRGGYKNIS